ncbi:imelysin family protein [Hansschlegelia sp. KR7-227]|uniref:imelysin family protein n=1 Tax=Hansschlegelia sp. KR7-227 TaxID=3400914 RepID=UPI003BFBB2D0
MSPRLALAALIVAAACLPARAAAPDPGPLAVRVIESYLLPRYDAFAGATAEQRAAWAEACRDGDFAPDIETLRERFRTASDAWSAVEHVTTGPISLSLRPDRVFFAPDRRNAVAKAIAELETRAQTGEISAETMRRTSVAAQGFPALERLLYDSDGGDAGARCRVGVAIADNLAGIAGDVAKEWRADDGPLARLKRGEGDPVHFADPTQAVARLLTDLAGGVQRVNDVKLLAVMGSSAETARPKAAEGWRSGRSARSIKVLVASLAAEARAFTEAAPKGVAASDGKAFAAASAAVAQLPDDIGAAAADPARRKTLEAAIAALRAAQNDVAKTLAPALGATIGFNALDGD